MLPHDRGKVVTKTNYIFMGLLQILLIACKPFRNLLFTFGSFTYFVSKKLCFPYVRVVKTSGPITFGCGQLNILVAHLKDISILIILKGNCGGKKKFCKHHK